MGESTTKCAFKFQYILESSVQNNDGHIDAIRHLLFTNYFTKPYSYEHILAHLLRKEIVSELSSL